MTEIMEKLKGYIGKFSRDSRTIKPGDVYIALIGENYDGHDFVVNSLDKGADYAIVSKEVSGVDSSKLIMVKDTLEALEQIASYVRKNSRAKVVAITGSSGKTSTKELLKNALQGQGRVHATEGNLNNIIGLPLTMANMPLDTDFAVIEMGMNHTGELSHLTAIARPDIVIITNIGRAHHEFFPKPEDIARAKAEAFEGIAKGGAAIIHNGPFFSLLKAEAEKHTKHIVSFGKPGDLRLVGYDDGKVKAEVLGERLSYHLQMKGEHQAINSLAILGAVKMLGGNIRRAVENISAMESLKGRGQTVSVKIPGGEIVLIDDAYNANPDSMAAAIRVLGTFRENRKIAVLGEMRELGTHSKELHQELYAEIKAAAVDMVYCCCGDMKALYDMVPSENQGGWGATSADLQDALKRGIKPGDIVLVKGSLGSNMLILVDYIKAMKES